ncbi:hypothetical protein [Arsenicicoccus dermatophilus]|uniref:hypothetical protein n=1 Tax=Arsenicicoccus dermatophilus TaxID=1076331 RepID=UPI001F4CA772|nr:hypothetical protein [Arsenicicoccus dermatophilus]MCH8613223.1 hypothetical protein [Arsenicicoccus dermatophilus]
MVQGTDADRVATRLRERAAAAAPGEGITVEGLLRWVQAAATSVPPSRWSID